MSLSKFGDDSIHWFIRTLNRDTLGGSAKNLTFSADTPSFRRPIRGGGGETGSRLYRNSPESGASFRSACWRFYGWFYYALKNNDAQHEPQKELILVLFPRWSRRLLCTQTANSLQYKDWAKLVTSAAENKCYPCSLGNGQRLGTFQNDTITAVYSEILELAASQISRSPP